MSKQTESASKVCDAEGCEEEYIVFSLISEADAQQKANAAAAKCTHSNPGKLHDAT